MLPSDRSPGPFRRFLIYFGLAAPPEDGLNVPSASPVPQPAREDGEERGIRKALVYFGLAEGPDPSRYGTAVERELDDDIDALRSRVAELEARLRAIEDVL